MKFYPREIFFKNWVLKGSKLFGYTKQKIYVPLGADCNSRQPNKVTYFIHLSTIGETRQHIEE